ncbi:MAG: hypothetical protein IT435_00620 [Phycisphaerales bacterium]|nr:hypothetical protein [Phycisphaerales bacterium]
MEHRSGSGASSAAGSSEACCEGTSCCGGASQAGSRGASDAQGCCAGGGSGGGGVQTAPLTAPISAIQKPKPAKDEFLALETHALIHRYRRGIENFDRRIFFLDEQQLDMAFLPDAGVGRWPIRVLVGHLADADIATIHRVRRAVAEEHPVIAAWDEDAFIDAGVYGHASAATPGDGNGKPGLPSSAFPLAGFVAVIHTLRRWMSEWLMTLRHEQWERVAMHPQRGELSVKKLIAYDAWHLENHAWFLNAKVEKMLGVDVGEEPVMGGGGGCGSGCGCKG